MTTIPRLAPARNAPLRAWLNSVRVYEWPAVTAAVFWTHVPVSVHVLASTVVVVPLVLYFRVAVAQS